MLEKHVEAHQVRKVKEVGGVAFKFTSPSRRSVPDRLNLLPVPEEHQAIVNRYVKFVELKAPGKLPTAGQQREHAKLKALGFHVDVLDSKKAVDNWAEREL